MVGVVGVVGVPDGGVEGAGGADCISSSDPIRALMAASEFAHRNSISGRAFNLAISFSLSASGSVLTFRVRSADASGRRRTFGLGDILSFVLPGFLVVIVAAVAPVEACVEARVSRRGRSRSDSIVGAGLIGLAGGSLGIGEASSSSEMVSERSRFSGNIAEL